MDPVRASIEQWLLDRGAPHFIEGYRATTNVWTRAFPALLATFVLGIIAEVGLAAEVAVLALSVTLAALVGLWALSNRWRGRRPFARPDTIRTPELLLFVLTPGIVSLVLDRNIGRAATSVAIGIAILTVVYFVTSYGIVTLLAYVVRNAGHQLRLIGNLSSRALPLLLLITVTIFITGETWQMSSRLVGLSQVATIALFVLAGGLFLLTRVPGEIAAVENFDHWSDVGEAVAGTPAAAVVLPVAGDPQELERTRGQFHNLVVMVLAAQAVQITLVSGTVYAFFVLLGIAAVHPDTAKAWIGAEPNILASVKLQGSTFAISEELLRVGGFLAAFAGLAFTVYLVTDSTYREEFSSNVSEELRTTLAVHTAYRHHLGRDGSQQ